MKPFFALFSLFFVFSGNPFAQATAKNSASSNPSVIREGQAPPSQHWEKEKDLVNGHISHSKLSRMQHVTKAIMSLLQDSCIAERYCTPVWHGEYFSEKTSPGPHMKFGVSCHFFDQKAHLTIMANDIGPLLDHLVVNNQDFLTIKPIVSVKNDCAYFEYDTNNTGDTETAGTKTLRSKSWLVITSDTAGKMKLPYSPVTRKEYLQEARKEINSNKNRIIEDLKHKMPVHSAEDQEADKKAVREQLSSVYSGIDLQVRMRIFLKNYKTDEQYLKENTDRETSDLDSTLHLMDSLLNHLSSDDLNKPAIVSTEAAGFRGFGNGNADKMLIRMNPAYFNPYLGGEKPQFFLVCWHYDPSEPIDEGIDRQMREGFDCQKLKDMLGK
jgi:hypothetical protein